MVEHLPVLAWAGDETGYIYSYSRAWYDYTGATPAQVVGWGWRTVHDPAHLPQVLDHWRAALASGEPFEMTFPLRRADGVFRPFLTRAVPCRDDDGVITHWFGACTDVTALHEAEKEAESSARLLQAVIDAVPVAVYAKDLDGRITLANQAACDALGAPASEVLRRSEDAFLDAEQARAIRELDRRVLEEGTMIEQEENAGYDENGPRVFLSRKRPLNGEHGATVGLVGSSMDITERKRSEAVLAAERASAEQTRETLIGELHHRVKNLFTLSLSLVTLSARAAGDKAALVEAVSGRLMALARAHELVRPLPEAPTGKRNDLDQLLRTIIEPFVNPDCRVELAGPPVALGGASVTHLALTLHELTTNSVKHGAMCVPGGVLNVRWSVTDETVTLDWAERGGTRAGSAPTAIGFGSRLIELSVGQQLGGTVERAWHADGLAVRLTLPLDRLTTD